MIHIIDDLRKENFMNYYKEIKNLIEEKEINDKVRYLESNKFILEYVSDLSLMLTTYKLENNLKKL